MLGARSCFGSHVGGCRDQKFGGVGKVIGKLRAERQPAAGRDGSPLGLGILQDTGREQAREHTSPCHCVLGWDTLGRGWLIPGAAVGLGVARGPLLIPGSSLTPRARDAPREGTSPKAPGRTSSLPKCTSRFPGGSPPPLREGSHQLPRVSGEIHARRAGTALYTTHIHPHGACPPCSPTQDRILDGKEGALQRKPGLCPPRPRSPRPQRAARGRGHVWPARRRLHGLGAAPTGRVDICNQHAGSGKGRAARPGGKLTLTLSLIKQNNQAVSWSGDVAAAGGAGLGAVWERHSPPPLRDELQPRPEPRRAREADVGPGGVRLSRRPCRPGPGNTFFPPLFACLCKKTRGAQHGGGGPRVSGPRREEGGLPGGEQRGGKAGGAPGSGFR